MLKSKEEQSEFKSAALQICMTVFLGSSVSISVRLGIKLLTVWKKGNEEMQNLIAVPAIDVSFHWQNRFREGVAAEGSQFSGKLV